MSLLKVLTICAHGNIRSVALAYLLKTIYGYDVLACGVEDTGEDTFLMLYNWADKVILLDPNLMGKVEKKLGFDPLNDYKDKFQFLDVGEDKWHDANAEELRHKLLKGLKTLKL